MDERPPPPFSAAPEPYVLTWDGEGSSQEINLPEDVPVPEENPPEYATARRPTVKIRYTFSPIGANSMIIIPPATAQDTRPKYYITTSVNVFMPTSHITTVYRGANEYGEKIGEFEMGIIALPAKFYMKNNSPCAIRTVLNKEYGSRADGRWHWNPSVKKYGHVWDYSKRVATCTSLDIKRSHLASYKYPTAMDLFHPNVLEVTPLGQEFFDHLLMSLLIIERKRLTPGTGHLLKELFNQ